jgi:hypothetical protein
MVQGSSSEASGHLGIAAMARASGECSVEAHVGPLPACGERVENDEGGARAGAGRFARPPGIELCRTGRAECAERRVPESEHVEHLGRPGGDEDMRLARPAAEPKSRRERRPKIGALRVVRSRGLLNVRESRAILEVKQRTPLDIPGDGSARPANW